MQQGKLNTINKLILALVGLAAVWRRDRCCGFLAGTTRASRRCVGTRRATASTPTGWCSRRSSRRSAWTCMCLVVCVRTARPEKHQFVSICLCTFESVCRNTYIHTYTHTHIHVYNKCTHMHMHTCTYTHAHAQACTHAHTHIHTHTCTPAPAESLWCNRPCARSLSMLQ